MYRSRFPNTVQALYILQPVSSLQLGLKALNMSFIARLSQHGCLRRSFPLARLAARPLPQHPAGTGERSRMLAEGWSPVQQHAGAAFSSQWTSAPRGPPTRSEALPASAVGDGGHGAGVEKIEMKGAVVYATEMFLSSEYLFR